MKGRVAGCPPGTPRPGPARRQRGALPLGPGALFPRSSDPRPPDPQERSGFVLIQRRRRKCATRRPRRASDQEGRRHERGTRSRHRARSAAAATAAPRPSPTWGTRSAPRDRRTHSAGCGPARRPEGRGTPASGARGRPTRRAGARRLAASLMRTRTRYVVPANSSATVALVSGFSVSCRVPTRVSTDRTSVNSSNSVSRSSTASRASTPSAMLGRSRVELGIEVSHRQQEVVVGHRHASPPSSSRSLSRQRRRVGPMLPTGMLRVSATEE